MSELRKVVAVDFDGTLCTLAYPDIGEPRVDIIDYVKYLKSQGWALILWTNREGALLEEAIKWCHSIGLYFDSVNAPLQERIDFYGVDSRKIGADLYIDDKSINPSMIESLYSLLEIGGNPASATY